MLILVLSNNQYLIGMIHGYCHAAGCKVKTLTINNVDIFLDTLKNESPSAVFIDIEKAAEILNSPEWATASTAIDANKIALCGIVNQSCNSIETLPQLEFNKLFTEPLSIEEIQYFLDEMLASYAKAKYERRSNERRRWQERRKTSVEHDLASVSIAKHLSNAVIPINELNLEQSAYKKPFVIDFDAKVITVNSIPIEISPKEFQLIELLAKKPNFVVNVEDIIKKIWPTNKHATKADVHQYIYILRHKLEENPHKPKYLITVKGFGYKLCM